MGSTVLSREALYCPWQGKYLATYESVFKGQQTVFMDVNSYWLYIVFPINTVHASLKAPQGCDVL